jgi:hypothetical protein
MIDCSGFEAGAFERPCRHHIGQADYRIESENKMFGFRLKRNTLKTEEEELSWNLTGLYWPRITPCFDRG